MSQPSGSVYQRADGYWVAAVSLAGKRIVRYARTERLARAKLAELQRQQYTGNLAAPNRLTVSEWVAEWLSQQEPNLRPSSLQTYRYALARILPHVGAQRLAKVTPALVAHAFGQLYRHGCGSRSAQQTYTYLYSAFERATDLGLIGHNPVAKVPRPHSTPKERTMWTVPQMKAFLDTAMSAPHQYAPLLAFLLGTGLRVSEALGLRWSDVDWEQGTVSIRRALV